MPPRLALHRLPRRLPALSTASSLRPFTTTRPTLKALSNLPPRRTIPETELLEKFLKGTGPGGQKINKTNSCVQLTHLPTKTQVKCQETRSREQNRTLARRMLADRLDELEHGAESRTERKRELGARRKGSKAKKARRKYRALEGDKAGEAGGEGGEAAELSGQTDGVDAVEEVKKRDEERP